MSDKDIIRAAVERYGYAAQTDIAIEEMAELTQALVKFRRDSSRDNLEHVREEMADVAIMLRQLALIYGSCDSWLEHKLNRLKERMGYK